MTKGELYNKLERFSGEFTVNAKSMINANPDHERMVLGDSVFTFDVRNALDAAKESFPVKYAYDAWEMPETNKQKEKMICEILKWYQQQFGPPTTKESNNIEAEKK